MNVNLKNSIIILKFNSFPPLAVGSVGATTVLTLENEIKPF